MDYLEFLTDKIESGKLYAYEGRCWYTCYKALKSVPARQRKNIFLAEGKANGNTHYWLQDFEGNIIDVHYILLEDGLYYLDDYTYEVERLISFNEISCDTKSDNYEDRPAFNWLGREKWVKVFHLDVE